jgi:hypothetical protein
VRTPTAVLVLLVSALLGVGVSVAVFQRGQMQDAQDARARAAQQRLKQVGQCLSLVHWTLEPGLNGGAVVRAEVLPGRDGRVALDAHGGRGGEDVLVPELQRERLIPAVVQSGQPVVLERRLRRLRPGEAEELSLRFSCRPPGPQGVFGVIEYNNTTEAETPDGFGGLLRPLPPPGKP